MAKYLKLLFAILLVAFTATSQAQCIPAPVILGQGYQGGSPCYGGVVQQRYYGQQQVVIGNQFAGYNTNGVQLIAPQIAQNGGLSQCQVVGGIAGGTLGSFAKHHQVQAVVLGAILGGIAGNAVCTNNQGQQVLVVQQPPQNGGNGVVVQQPPQLPPVQVVGQQPQQGLEVPAGDLRCPLRFQGQEVQVFMVKDPEACRAAIEYEARRRGWVRQ